MLRDLWEYLKAVARHWSALVTGAAITLALGILPEVSGIRVPPWAWQVALGIAVPWAGFLAWRDEYKKATELTAKPQLRVGLSHWDRAQIRHHRIEVRNDGPGSAQNVQVLLLGIEPRPKDATARCAFPYRVPNSAGDVGAWTINKGQTEYFDLAASWPSGDGRRIVEGLDGPEHGPPRQSPGKWRLSMDDDEEWRVRLQISGGNIDAQELVVSVHPEEHKRLLMDLHPA
ncbi:MAG: hypothetical protein ACREMM_00305 [Gemmatimonadales bacterium]